MPLLIDLTHNWREYAETLALSLLLGAMGGFAIVGAEVLGLLT